MYRLYSRSLNKAALLCAASVVLTFGSYLLITEVGVRFIGLYVLMSMVMSLTVAFSPLAFNSRDTTLMRQVPVGAGTKTLFYVVPTGVILPLLVQLLWWTMSLVGSWLLDRPDLYMDTYEVVMNMYSSTVDYMNWVMKDRTYLFSGLTQMLLMSTVTLYVVLCTRPERRILRVVLVHVGICVIYGILCLVTGVVIGFRDAMMNMPMRTDDEIAMSMMDNIECIVWIYSLVSMMGVALCVYGIYRHLSRVK